MNRRSDNSKRDGDICSATGLLVPCEFLGGRRIYGQTRLSIYNPILREVKKMHGAFFTVQEKEEVPPHPEAKQN